MKFEKNYKIGHKWKRVYLDEEDVEELDQELRTRNRGVFLECVEDAKKLSGPVVKTEQIVDVAVALFEKRGMKLFTMIQARLDEIVKKERDEHRKKSKKLRKEKYKHG